MKNIRLFENFKSDNVDGQLKDLYNLFGSQKDASEIISIIDKLTEDIYVMAGEDNYEDAIDIIMDYLEGKKR